MTGSKGATRGVHSPRPSVARNASSDENTPCGRKRKTKTVYGTYREACTELDRIHVERANDNPVPTIAQAYGTWLEPSMEALVAAGTLAPNTRNLVTRSSANYVGPTCGTMPVDQLRPVHLNGS